jgi:soluble lytic murein transglycosylase-like protein
MTTPIRAAATLLVVALLASAAPALATLYSFVDESGVTHYTNVPSDPRFRKVPGSTPPRAGRSGSGSVAAEKYEAEIARCADNHGVDSALVKAVIKAESNYDNRAISRAGAQGLMQLMPATSRLRNVDNPFNPQQNIDGGVRHLKYLLSTFNGDTKLALAAYNAGENAVRRYKNSVPPYPETKNYVSTVLSHYGRYSGLVPGAEADAAAAIAQTAQIQSFVNAEGTRVFTNVPWKYLEAPGWQREHPR